MAYDILSLVTKEERDDPEGRVWYAVKPDKVYPATIKRIQEVLASGELPAELVDPNSPLEVDPRGVARLYLSDARKVNLAAWDYALQPLVDGMGEFVRSERAQALEIARRWFTQALHVVAGGNGAGMGVHILKDERYRL